MKIRSREAKRIQFYREWSAMAAESALHAVSDRDRSRCEISASVWSYIADAIESGQDREVERLTGNLLLLENGVLVPTS